LENKVLDIVDARCNHEVGAFLSVLIWRFYTNILLYIKVH